MKRVRGPPPRVWRGTGRPDPNQKEVIVRKLLPILLVSAALIPMGVMSASAAHGDGSTRTVKVPEEDRFTPFAVTIHAGDAVRWFNGDGDDHTVVSDDAFNTAGHKGTDHLLPSGDT